MKNISDLLFNVLIGSGEIYKPLTEYGTAEEALKQLVADYKPDDEMLGRIEDVAAEHTYIGEKHGFKQGLKIGLRLMALAMGDKGK